MTSERSVGASPEAADEVRRTVAEGASTLGVRLAPSDLEALLVHFRTMMRWRRRADLTALTDPHEIAVRHYLDSLTLARHVPSGATVADLGTGAGFPGIPLAIARADIPLTLLETRDVKLAFLHHVVSLLGRSNIQVQRTTQVVGGAHGAPFDLVVARAVADATETLDRCSGLVKASGEVWLMRGPSRVGEPVEGLHGPFRVAGELHVELPVERAPRRIVMYRRLVP